MKRILLGACAVVLLAGFATAQTVSTNGNPPPPPPQDQQADGPDSEGGGWFSGHRHGRHHGEMGGPMQNGMGVGGGPGMRMEGKGFGLMVGPGHFLHVNCGEEPMKDCITSAQPLIDALGKLDFKMPPPPASAVPPAQ